MRIVGLLSWFDERPSWLAASCAAAASVVDHVVAVDGAYLGFPGGRARSDGEQADTVRSTLAALGVGVTVHVPGERWLGQPEKRSLLFTLGLAVAEPGDWLLVFDADELVTRVPPGLRAELEATEHAVASVQLATSGDGVSGVSINHRRLFRALPGLHVEGLHWRYVAGDGRVLWGREEEQEPALPTGLMLDHRRDQRAGPRRERAQSYYQLRRELNLEPVRVPA